MALTGRPSSLQLLAVLQRRMPAWLALLLLMLSAVLRLCVPLLRLLGEASALAAAAAVDASSANQLLMVDLSSEASSAAALPARQRDDMHLGYIPAISTALASVLGGMKAGQALSGGSAFIVHTVLCSRKQTWQQVLPCSRQDA